MATLTMTKGVQGSGKTTWAKSTGQRIVCKDDIRAEMAIKDWNYDVEKEVLRRRDFQISQALSSGKDVISADTNLAPKHEITLRTLAMKYKAVFEVKSFLDVPLDECIRRDALRDEPVGEKVIRDTAEQFCTPEYLVPSRGSPQLFVDLDGVLADFDGFISKEFGIENNRDNERPDFWDIVRGYSGRLYYDMGRLPGAKEFWEELRPYNPIILSGVPWSIQTAAQDKREWVAKYIDPEARVITCRSRSKSKYAVRGDILIDDWAKYQSLWEEKGGIWILHKDNKSSLTRLKEVLGA